MNETMKLAPGRELDALVAEKVMGWLHTESWQSDGEITGTTPDYRAWVPVPRYSTDWAAAGEVVEKVRAQMPGGWGFELEDVGVSAVALNTWRAAFMGADAKWEALSDSAPHAICLAALQAVGYQGA
jgi:hypothetical protein